MIGYCGVVLIVIVIRKQRMRKAQEGQREAQVFKAILPREHRSETEGEQFYGNQKKKQIVPKKKS